MESQGGFICVLFPETDLLLYGLILSRTQPGTTHVVYRVSMFKKKKQPLNSVTLQVSKGLFQKPPRKKQAVLLRSGGLGCRTQVTGMDTMSLP